MNISPAIKAMENQLVEWRRALHRRPELAFEEHETAAFIATQLRAFGLEVHEGLAGTGVIGILRNGEGPSVGLRADIDALPIAELTGADYASETPGKMHACGHDGHTTMLLGAAQVMAADPPGPGTVVFIFQPAEENEGGARVMIEDGLLEQFPLDSTYALHNWPGLEAGRIAMRAGPVMAAFDTFELKVMGRGSHGAMPHEGIDPITLAAQLQMAWQTIVSRAVDPTDAAVISVTQIHAGHTLNVIPDEVILRGTVRTLRPATRDFVQAEMTRRAEMIAEAFHASAELTYQRRYPATINSPEAAETARRAAEAIVGRDAVQTDYAPSMASEDFAFLLEKVPGAYGWIGNGSAEGGRNLHSPHYDFNDEILPLGVQFFVEVARRALIGANE
ncbi:peptidase M20 [Thioclava sp. L04-15]|uniref:M20 aminoacylase family protein n=1 Tax=Thioclava sp. L04-15 TaxID=1915318 RepID=UPI0009964A83|nr:M20 aminoacylase family protein [Thioclava sp. L04-15]OOY26846.1 peptidase M20 [Thioclava sp. L04-15]TNE94585.1 MAG: amidohydrolase [Paracoccaceae bacterium]